MVRINKLQLFCSALTVTLAFSGCRGRQVQQPTSGYHRTTQSHQHFGGSVQGNQMLIPTPDTLPPAAALSKPGPASGQDFQNLEPVSSTPKKGILQLLPMFRSKNTQQTVQMPPAGAVLTEEQFNALSGQAVGMPMQAMPQQPMQPIPETQWPPATRAPQPVQQMQPQASLQVQQPLQHQHVPARQVGHSGGVPVHPASSARHQTPVLPNAPQSGLIRDFGPQTFGAAANMNFGGAWGQKVPQTNQVQQQPSVATYGDPLEIPNIDESYDLWPQSPVEENVAQQTPPAFEMPTTTNTTEYGPQIVGDAPMMRVTDHSLQQSQQPSNDTRMLPLIVPAPKNQ